MKRVLTFWFGLCLFSFSGCDESSSQGLDTNPPTSDQPSSGSEAQPAGSPSSAGTPDVQAGQPMMSAGVTTGPGGIQTNNGGAMPATPNRGGTVSGGAPTIINGGMTTMPEAGGFGGMEFGGENHHMNGGASLVAGSMDMGDEAGSLSPGGMPAQICPIPGGARIQVCGHRLYVDQEEFFVKGVNWSPFEPGTSPNFGQSPHFAGRVDQDARMMAAIGINVVKLYSACTDMAVLDALFARGIYVIQPVFNYWDMNGDGRFSEQDLNAIDRTISASKRNGEVHPAILMWSVGNEWNYNGFYNYNQWGNGPCWSAEGRGGGPPASYACPGAINAAVQAFQRVKAMDTSVPLTTIWGEVPSADVVAQIDDHIDIWSSNVYRFNSFGSADNQIINQYAALTEKPFFVGEFGCDAWNTNEGRLDEGSQADCNRRLMQTLADNSTLTGGRGLGGTLFEWNDEWWKYGAGNAGVQDSNPGGAPGAGPAPDGRFNEEYWGIVDMSRQPRQSYYALCEVQNPMPGSNPAQCPEAPVNPQPGICVPAPPGDRLIIEVDLRQYLDPIQQVRLIGTFWGWNPNDGPIGIDHDGDGIYTVTFNDIPNVEFSYKWRINGETENLTGAGECVGNAVVYDFANRRWQPGEPNRIDVYGNCNRCQ